MSESRFISPQQDRALIALLDLPAGLALMTEVTEKGNNWGHREGSDAVEIVMRTAGPNRRNMAGQ